MKTNKSFTIDLELLNRVDKAMKKENTNFSHFMAKVLERYLSE